MKTLQKESLLKAMKRSAAINRVAIKARQVFKDTHTDEFLLRGLLASELKCWHRLTAEEAQNLVDFVRNMPAKPAQQQEPVCWVCNGTGVELDDANTKTPCPNCAEQPAQQEPVALREALASALTSVYVCGRVWSAWSVGTMSEDDFIPASECDEVLDELVSAVTTAAPQPAQRKPLTDEEIEQCMKQAYATVQGRNLEHAFARAIEAAHGIKENT